MTFDPDIHVGTGNVLKIQQLLHMCNEYHGNKEEEEGAESDAASPKEGGNKSGGGKKPAETATVGDGKDSGKDKKSLEASKAGKDAEMKDAEVPEPGSLSEPGAHQGIAVLGIALIAMGEDIGAEMALRMFGHLVSECECANMWSSHLFVASLR